MKRSLFHVAFLLLAGLLLLGPHAPQAGLHLDDHGFHHSLSQADWAAVWNEFLSYVPGRNLYILYYAALYKILGPSPERLHLFGLFLELLNVALVYALLRQMRAQASWGLFIAGMFLVYPNHGETHFWTAAVAMNLLSTTLLLSCFWIAGASQLKPALRWPAATLLYAMALFDYDQAFFMWIPLLFYVWILLPGPRPSQVPALWLIACGLAMNLAHLLLRLFVPVSSGGRPMIVFANFPRSFLHSLLEALIPLRKLPIWDCLRSWAGGPVPTLVLVLVLSGLWIVLVKSDWRREERAPRALIVFGLLWFFCAYLPNYFWYISPRHNYLPSFGLLLALAWGAERLLAFPRLRHWLAPALAGSAFLFFAVSGASALAEGYAWKLSTRLQEQFIREARELLGPRVENLFLLGAPMTLARAPAFKQPGEHRYLFAQAAGHLPATGDIVLSPTHRGAFYGNQVELFGKDSMWWEPYAGMNLLLYRSGKFSCAARLQVEAPTGDLKTVSLQAPASCRSSPRVTAPVWLASSELGTDNSPPLWTASNGASLLRLKGRLSSERLELETLWRAEKPLPDFAFTINVRHNGRLVFEPVYSQEFLGKRQYASLWPAYDDLNPPSGWTPGTAARAIHHFKLPGPIPSGPLEAELAVFERRDGAAWIKIGSCRRLLEQNP